MLNSLNLRWYDFFDYSFEFFVSPEFWNRESNYGYVCNDVDYKYMIVHKYSILIPVFSYSDNIFFWAS